MGRPPKYNTPEEMQRLIDLYFLACKSHQTNNAVLLEELSVEDLLIVNDIDDVYPTVCGLAIALGLTRQGLIEYGDKPEFSDTVKRAKAKSYSAKFQAAASGKMNPTIFIFDSVNNHGMINTRSEGKREHTGKDGGAIENKWTVEIVKAEEKE